MLAVVGHCFPVWLKFKAGKGVATGLGVFAVIAPWATLGAFVVFALIFWRTRYVSLGSIAAAAKSSHAGMYFSRVAKSSHTITEILESLDI